MIRPSDPEIIHASSVALNGRGVLILGPSRSGKSGLALQLMALGARLIADDRTEVFRQGDHLLARCPPTLSGLIEARGVGILKVDPLAQARIVLAVDLGQIETERLPPRRTISVQGVLIDLVLATQSAHFDASLFCYLQGQRYE